MDRQDIRAVMKYRWLIFGIMAVAYIFVYFHRLCANVVAVDIQRTFESSAAWMGILAAAYFVPYGLMQFPAGLLADSLGPRKTAAIFLCIAGVGSLMFGLAPSIEIAVAARLLVGIGMSMVFIPTMKIQSQWFRAGEFSFMTAVLVVMGGLGAWIATTPLALVTGTVGWRLFFEIIGAGTLIIALLAWLIVRDRPRDMGLPSLAEIDHVGSQPPPRPSQIPLWEGARWVVTERYFWPVAIWFFFLVGVFFSFGGIWAGPYLMHAYGMTRAEAAGIQDMIALGLIVGSPLLSFLSDRVFRSRKKVLVAATGVLVAELIFLNMFPVGLSRLTLYAVFLIFCISSSAIVVIAFTSTKELFPVEIAGTSVGTVNLFPFLGGAVMQIVLGRVLDGYPRSASGAYPIEAYSSMLLILLGAAVVALLCTFMMKETVPSRQP